MKKYVSTPSPLHAISFGASNRHVVAVLAVKTARLVLRFRTILR